MKVAIAVDIKETKTMLKTYLKGNNIVVSYNTDGTIDIYCNPVTCCGGIIYNEVAGVKFEGGPVEYNSVEDEYQYHHAKSIAETLISVL